MTVDGGGGEEVVVVEVKHHQIQMSQFTIKQHLQLTKQIMTITITIKHQH